MKISHESNINGYFIRSYASERITIAYPEPAAGKEKTSAESGFAEEILEQSFIITANQLIRDWSPQSVKDLRQNHCDQLLALGPELVVLGTGKTIRFPDQAWSAGLFEKGVGLEIMDTGAACRTYSILASDGRNVAAALMIE